MTVSPLRTPTKVTPPVAAGVPGVASNAPNTQAVPVYPHETSAPQSAKTESGTYGVSKTVRHVIDTPGRVRRLTAAIVVNDRLMQPATKTRAAVWQPRPADELRNLTALAQAAVGFDAPRGDVITIEDMAFDGNRPQPPETLAEQSLRTAEASPNLIKYAALLMGLLVVVAFGLRPAIRRIGAAGAIAGRARAVHRELPSSASAQATLNPPEPAEIDPERLRSQEIFAQVSEHLKREPTQSSRLLQSWIHSD